MQSFLHRTQVHMLKPSSLYTSIPVLGSTIELGLPHVLYTALSLHHLITGPAAEVLGDQGALFSIPVSFSMYFLCLCLAGHTPKWCFNSQASTIAHIRGLSPGLPYIEHPTAGPTEDYQWRQGDYSCSSHVPYHITWDFSPERTL